MKMSYGSLNSFRNNNALLVEVDHLMVAKTHRNISLFIRLIKTAIERVALLNATYFFCEEYLIKNQIMMYEKLGCKRLCRLFAANDVGIRHE